MTTQVPTPLQFCSIAPYFKVHPGKMDEFRDCCVQFMEKTQQEPKCLYYGFSFDGDQVHCREGYEDAEGVLTHLENVAAILTAALVISELARLEIHGPAVELAKLKEPLAHLNAQFFTVESGFYRSK